MIPATQRKPLRLGEVKKRPGWEGTPKHKLLPPPWGAEAEATLCPSACEERDEAREACPALPPSQRLPHLLHLGPVVEHIPRKVKFLGVIVVTPSRGSSVRQRLVVQVPRCRAEATAGRVDAPEGPGPQQPLHGGAVSGSRHRSLRSSPASGRDGR